MCRTGLADGLAFLGLTADRENPTSNLIYQRLGFNPVAETQEVRFIQAT
jgi:predicted GNAT family acetyltransferase